MLCLLLSTRNPDFKFIKNMLRGLTVVSMEQAVAAPFCTSRLADAGATVIKIERKGVGDFARAYDRNALGSSTYFAWLNRGKRSLELDIKAPEDKARLLKLIEKKADVYVQNLAPGAAERAGFGSANLRKLNPRLVTLDITGYGREGPNANYKAYDLLVAAEAGLCYVTGSPESPGRVGVSICDITTGMNGFSAILQGLYHREKTGEGSGYHISMFDTVAEIMNVPFLQTKFSNNKVVRAGLKHPSIAPYGAFKTSDGRSILISIQNEREWAKLCNEVLGNSELATDPRFVDSTSRVANRDVLDALIEEFFGKKTADELASELLKADIAFGELRDMHGLVHHPQLRTMTFKTELGKEIAVPAPAITPNPESLGDVPRLGEHNKEIEDEISRL